jgi:hypothetical protein
LISPPNLYFRPASLALRQDINPHKSKTYPFLVREKQKKKKRKRKKKKQKTIGSN